MFADWMPTAEKWRSTVYTYDILTNTHPYTQGTHTQRNLLRQPPRGFVQICYVVWSPPDNHIFNPHQEVVRIHTLAFQFSLVDELLVFCCIIFCYKSQCDYNSLMLLWIPFSFQNKTEMF